MVDAGLFQGLKDLRERNWQDLPVPASSIAGDRADARAPGSLRLSAAARGAGLPRTRVLHAGHAGPLPHRPRPTPDGCRKKTRRSRTSTASRSTSRRCRSTPRWTPPAPLAAAAVRLRPDDAGRAGHRGRVRQRRPPARLVIRAHADRRPHDHLRRRSRPLRPAGAAGSDAVPTAPTSCWSNRPTAIAFTSTTTTAIGWRRS